jgi:hypothetical protein
MLIRKMKNSLERTNDRLRMGIENELFQKDRSDEANFTRKKKKTDHKSYDGKCRQFYWREEIIMIKNTRIMGL